MIKLQDIFTYLSKNGASKPGKIADDLNSNRVSTGKLLQEGIKAGYIVKTGNVPHVLYDITHLVYEHASIENINYKQEDVLINLDYKDRSKIESFYKFESDGSLLQGKDGFIKRCRNTKRNIDPMVAIKRYIQIIDDVDKKRNRCGLIEVSNEFRASLMKRQKGRDLFMNEVYYCDRNIYDEFGRGPLAEKAFIAKTSSNKQLNELVANEILEYISCIIQAKKIDAIAIVPRSIDRKVQILGVLKKKCEIFKLPFIQLIKYFPNNIPIAQKSLKGEQRFINAMSSIQIDIIKQNKDKHTYTNILLIDDFVGSGATMNIAAMKIKQIGIGQNIFGLAFVGNFDMSYEIINEI